MISWQKSRWEDMTRVIRRKYQKDEPKKKLRQKRVLSTTKLYIHQRKSKEDGRSLLEAVDEINTKLGTQIFPAKIYFEQTNENNATTDRNRMTRRSTVFNQLKPIKISDKRKVSCNVGEDCIDFDSDLSPSKDLKRKNKAFILSSILTKLKSITPTKPIWSRASRFSRNNNSIPRLCSNTHKTSYTERELKNCHRGTRNIATLDSTPLTKRETSPEHHHAFTLMKCCDEIRNQCNDTIKSHNKVKRSFDRSVKMIESGIHKDLEVLNAGTTENILKELGRQSSVGLDRKRIRQYFGLSSTKRYTHYNYLC